MTTQAIQVARSIGVIGGTLALVVGITLAAAGDVSTATLASNNLSASTNLQIAPDVAGSPGAYLTSVTGFSASVSGMRFGTERLAGDFWLRDAATGDQAVHLSIPAPPTLTGVTADKIHVHIKKGAVEELNTTFDQLIIPSAGANFTNHISPSAGGTKYTVFYTIDAPTGGATTASVGNFDLTFTGTEL